MDLAYNLTHHVVQLKFDDLPKNVVRITKKFILDTLGTMVAGSTAPGCSEVVQQVKEWGGKPESTIMLYGGKVPAPNAALCNSMMSHALDFDDTHDIATLHANVSTLPAALATAEATTGEVSGKDLITAVALGVDMTSRLGLGVVGPLMWNLTSLTGYFGATVAAGKILGLEEEVFHNALGIVYSQCAGNLQCAFDGALVKRMQPGFAAHGAITSCVLAQRGITGAKDIFDGSKGFINVYFRGNYDRIRVLDGLGTVFEGANLSHKLYPCCRYTHATIDATLDIVQHNQIDPNDVVEIIAHVTQDIADHVGRPFELRESPQVDAQFSVAYTTAISILKKDVFIDDFLAENVVSNRRAHELAKKVRIIVDQEPIEKGLTPCTVEIRTKNGGQYRSSVDILRGDPRKPISFDDIADKFRKCAAFSVIPIPDTKINEIIGIAGQLEDLRNINRLTRAFITE
jgi:2-methylcitrate dehydratase PrpD